MKLTLGITLFFYVLTVSFPTDAQSIALNSAEVIRRTLADNSQVQSLQLNDDIAAQDVVKAKSQFDTLLRAGFSYTKDKSERTSIVFGTESSKTEYNLGASQLLPTGTAISVDLLNTKETTDSPFATNPSFFDTRSQINISQPLLNNAVGFQNRSQLTASKIALEAAEQDRDAQILRMVFNHLQIYWSWYYTQRLKIISDDAVSAAARLFRTNRQKMVIGLIEESDLYAFAANVDLKSSDLYLVEANLASSESLLRTALNLPYDKLSLKAEPSSSTVISDNVDEMVSHALAHHPDYLALQKQLEAQNIQVRINKNSKLPQLDLVASLSLNGLDPGFESSMGDFADGHPIWQSGLQFSLPLQNRRARSNHKQSNLIQSQLLYATKDIETRLVSQIRQGYRKLIASRNRMRVVATAVKHQNLKWEGEIIKYDQGRSDPDLVIRYQNDYLEAQKLYIQTQMEYQMARTELEYYSARLLNDIN